MSNPDDNDDDDDVDDDDGDDDDDDDDMFFELKPKKNFSQVHRICLSYFSGIVQGSFIKF